MTDTLKMIQTKEGEFSQLRERMDDDAKLAYLEDYEFQDAEGKKISRVISMTMNDPMVFANTVVSALSGSTMQTVVEGLSDKQNGMVERFLEEVYTQADEWLLARRISSLFSWLCSHICIRGWVGVRWISRMEGEKYIADCLPVDMRWCVFDSDAEGLTWVAPTFRRSKAAVEREYGDDLKGRYVKDSNEIEVRDYWDGEKNEVWIDGNLVRSSKHAMGQPPFVIGAAGNGFMLQDIGFLKHEGESIFMMTRDLYEEWNRIASIEQTLNMDLVLPPYEKVTETPGDGPMPEYPIKPGKVTEVGAKERYNLLQLPALGQASQLVHADVAGAIQRGSLSNVDYGNLQFPLSAVAIADITEIRGKVLIPRLDALARFYQLMGKLIISQHRAGGFSAAIGRAGKRNTYEGSEIPDPDDFSLTYKFMSRSKRQEIANLAMGLSAQSSRIMSRETIIRDVMQTQNPDEEIARLDAEEAEALDPAIKVYRKATALLTKAGRASAEEADRLRIEARLMGNRAVEIIKQRKMAAMTTPPKESAEVPEPPRGNAQALIPLLAGSNGGGRAAGANNG